DLPYDGYEQNKVRSIFKDLGFQSLLSRVGGEANEEEEINDTLTDIDYTIVDTVTSDMFTGDEALVIEMLEDNYHTAAIERIGIVNDKAAYFIPPEIALKTEAFSEWAENKNNTNSVFDAKRT